MAEAAEEVKSVPQEARGDEKREHHTGPHPAHREKHHQLVVGAPQTHDKEGTRIDHDAADTGTIPLGEIQAELRRVQDARHANPGEHPHDQGSDGVPGLKELDEQRTRRLATEEGSYHPTVRYNQYDEPDSIRPESPLLRDHGTNPDQTSSRLRRFARMLNVPGQIMEARRNRAARRERDRQYDLSGPHNQPGEQSERLITTQQAERIKDTIESNQNEQEITDASQEYRQEQKAEARANSRWRKVVRAGINRVAEYFTVPDSESITAGEAAPDGYVEAGLLNDLDAMRETEGHVSVYDAGRGDNSVAIRADAQNYSVGGRENTQLGGKFVSLFELDGSNDVWALSRPLIGKHRTNRAPFEITRIDRATGRVDKRTTVEIHPDKSISIPFGTKNAPPIMVDARLNEGVVNLHAFGDTRIHVLASQDAIVPKEKAPQAA